MYEILVHTHSGLRWVVLLLFIAVLAVSFSGLSGKKEFSEGNRKTALFAMIAFHTQFLLGLIMYFMSQKVSFAEGFMKDTQLRFFAVEHLVAMTIAMVLITIGYRKAKNASSDSKKRFKGMALYYTIAFIVVLASIPWPFRIAGSHWF